MLRRCRLITRDPALAQDAYQDAFINLIRYGSGFRKVTAKLRHLYTLCDRACFLALKKRGNVQHDDYVIDVLDDSENIGLRIENRQSLGLFWGELDEQEKQIAVLKYVDGLSQERIGETVGLSRQTSNKKLSRINEKAKELSEVGEHAQE